MLLLFSPLFFLWASAHTARPEARALKRLLNAVKCREERSLGRMLIVCYILYKRLCQAHSDEGSVKG